MTDATPSSTQIQLRLDRLRAGDEAARDDLLRIACDRLSRLARKMLRSFPVVRPWEQTDDVLQNASMRLCRALDDVKPASVRSFINLAAVQIRRELIDLRGTTTGRKAPGVITSTGPDRMARGAGPARRRRPMTQATRPGWRPGPSSTTRSGRCPNRRKRSSISCGIRVCLRPRPAPCWASRNAW